MSTSEVKAVEIEGQKMLVRETIQLMGGFKELIVETPSAEKVRVRGKELEVMLPDTRGVTFSRYGLGNLKLGPNVYTYSRLPGLPMPHGGTCPGASPECLSICYAFRITDPVRQVYEMNTATDEVPPLPDGAKIVRWHVSGDFNSEAYIFNWIKIVKQHPETKFFGYTRSWRILSLSPALERLRGLSNVQLFASMDTSIEELPPKSWRRSWLNTDKRASRGGFFDLTRQVATKFGVARSSSYMPPADGMSGHTMRTFDSAVNYLCPEETGRKPNCEACGYCISGKKGDVTFIVH